MAPFPSKIQEYFKGLIFWAVFGLCIYHLLVLLSLLLVVIVVAVVAFVVVAVISSGRIRLKIVNIL